MRCRLLFRCGHVARAGSHAQAVAARRSDLYFDFSKSAAKLAALRRISKHVLLTKIASDFCRCAGDRLAFLRKVGNATRIFAEPPEKSWVFFLAIRTDEGN